MGTFSIWHWLIVLVVVLLLFGRNKIPMLMGDMAKGIKAFKAGMKEEPEPEPEPESPAKQIDDDATTTASDASVSKDEAAKS